MPQDSSLPEAFHQTQAVQAIGKQQMIHVRHSISNPCLCDYGIFGESLPMIMGSCNANLHFVWSLARAAQPCSGNSLPYVVSHSGSLAPAFLTNGTAAVSLEAGTMWCSSLSLTGRCGDASPYVFVVTRAIFFIVTALFIPFHSESPLHDNVFHSKLIPRSRRICSTARTWWVVTAFR
jgi:hypothetical protein